jgi:hypothetical protein
MAPGTPLRYCWTCPIDFDTVGGCSLKIDCKPSEKLEKARAEMKKLFPGYFRPDEAEIKQLWSEGLIAFDANVLLNLYRYSDETREEFLRILNLFKEKLLLPKTAAQEFFSNRLDVIVKQERSYEETLGEIKKLEDKFSNARQHPFLSQDLLARLTKLFREVAEELEVRQKRYFDQINEDPLLIKLNEIFADRILSGFSKDRLIELAEEGKRRYSDNIPPGCGDAGKSQDGDPLRKFGDFFLWKELLEHGKEQKRPLIFVTDDKKEDWWLKVKGRTLGPRPELIAEFREHAGQMFHMYLPDRFLEWASKQRGEEVKPAALSEVRELQSVRTSAVVHPRMRDTEKEKQLRLEIGYDLEILEKLTSIAEKFPQAAIKESWEILSKNVIKTAKVFGFKRVEGDDSDLKQAVYYLSIDVLESQQFMIDMYGLKIELEKIDKTSNAEDAQVFVKSCMTVLSRLRTSLSLEGDSVT